MNDWKIDDLITIAGYEVPADTSHLARVVLMTLRVRGTVIFTYDDGPSMLVCRELVDIAGCIGLSCHEESHRLTLIDENPLQVIAGGICSVTACEKLAPDAAEPAAPIRIHGRVASRRVNHG